MSISLEITKAIHVKEYKVELHFNDNSKRVFDFQEAFDKYAKGDCTKWRSRRNFVRFKVVQGNIVWGVNWDIVFPLYQLHNGRIE
jgi:hypothetical protein